MLAAENVFGLAEVIVSMTVAPKFERRSEKMRVSSSFN
jgi:hypothetical protein